MSKHIGCLRGILGNLSARTHRIAILLMVLAVIPALAGSAAAASLTVTYPNGGETLYRYNTKTITWTSSGVTGDIAVDIYSGATNLKRYNVPNTGSYSWTIDASLFPAGTSYRIGLSAMSGTVYDFSNAYFTIANPTLTVTSPNGGEVWDRGSSHTITWSTVGVTGNVLLQLYQNNVASQTMVYSVPNTGSWSWSNISDPGSTLCKIGMSAFAGLVYDFSNNNFTIQPLVPTLSVPNGGESWIVGSTQRISWTNPGGYTSFNLELSRNGGSTWEPIESTLPSTYTYRDWTVTGAASTNCRVRVTGLYQGSTRNDISNASFSIVAPVPAPPSLSSPSNYGIFNGNTTTSITYQWSASSGATEYWLNVFPSGDAGNPKFNASVGSATSYAVSGVGSWTNGVYVWQVMARTGSGSWSAFSTSRQFIVDRPPSPPTLSSPANGASLEIGATQAFSWSTVTGAARYYYRLVRGTDLNATPIESVELTGTSRSTTFSDASYDAGTHLWGVRAIKVTPSGYNQSLYETTIGWGLYNTRTINLTQTPPNPPVPAAPANRSVYNRNNTTSITFSWGAVSGALEYGLNVFESGDSAHPKFLGSTLLNTSQLVTVNDTWNPNFYIWEVRVRTAAGWSAYSSTVNPREFVVDIPASPPTLSSPASGTNIQIGNTQSFSWTTDGGTARYTYRLVQGTDFNVTNQIVLSELQGGSLSTTFDDATYDAGTHTWAVRGIKTTPSGYNEVTYETVMGWGPYSSTRTIILTGTPPNAPVPAVPANRSVYNRNNTTSITFSWGTVPGAIDYGLNVFEAGDSANPKFLGSVGNVTSKAVAVDSSWNPNVYIWEVRVRTSAGWSDYSSSSYPREFVVDIPPAPPTVFAPADGALFSIDDTATFTWSMPAGLSIGRYYIRLVSGTNLSAAPVFELEPATSGMSLDLSAPPFSAGTHTWGVRAIKVTPAGYDPVYYETTMGWGGYTSRTFDIGASELALLTPAPGAVITSSDIQFSWENVGAVRYELNVDDDADFSTPEISRSDQFVNITGNSKNIEGNWLPPDTFYWRVKAVFGDGSETPWSQSMFTYDPPTYAQPVWQPLYRLLNREIHDHFYCSTKKHRDSVAANGWTDEGVEGHVSSVPFAGTDMVPLFRFWHTDREGGHYYVAGEAGREAALASPDYIYEGITGYVYATQQPGLVPLYYLRKEDFTDGSNRRDNFYTTSQFEKDNAINVYGFIYMGVTAYVSPIGSTGPMAWNPFVAMAGMGASPDNGNFKHSASIGFDLPGVGPALRFNPQYNSRAVYYPDETQILGPGWTHEYGAFVSEFGGALYVYWPSGAVHAYDAAPPHGCLVDGVYDQMLVDSQTQIRIKEKDQTVHVFVRPTVELPYVLKEIRDRNGNTLTCTYEPSGLRRLTQVVDASGRTLSFRYETARDCERRLSYVEDPLNRRINFAYDPATGDLLSYTDPVGGVTSYAYEPTLPVEHQLVKVTLPNQTAIDNFYLDRKLKSQQWSGQSGGMSLEYSGSLTTGSYAGTTRSFAVAFAPTSNPEQPRLPVSMTEGDATTQIRYDSVDHPALPTGIIDAAGNGTYYFYDAAGNCTEESGPMGSVTQYSYDAFNNITSVLDPMSHRTNYQYDGNGNLIKVTTATGAVTNIGRDGRGLVALVSNFAGTTLFTYDANGNLIRVTDPMNHQMNLEVDVAGRVQGVTDANGRRAEYQVDDRGLVTRVTDALNGVQDIVYDGNGQVASISGPGLTQTSWTYLNEQMASYQTPSHTTRYTYDSEGRLTLLERPLGDTSYSYDAAGQLTGINGSRSATLGRDLVGNVTSVLDAQCGVTFAYDQLNRLASTTDHWGNVVSFSYDRAGNTTQVMYAPDKPVDYTYDADNRLTAVRDWTQRTVSYSYLPDGMVSRIDYPNGVWTTYGYDNAARLIQMTHAGNSGIIASYAFGLDNAGNMTAIDLAEPLGAPEVVSESRSYTLNSASQLLSDGATSFAYDSNGNARSMTGQRSLTMTYDSENRLVNIDGQFSSVNLYDVFGNRRQATRNGVVTRYVVDPRGAGDVLIETDAAGNPLSYYVYGMGLVSRIRPDDAIHYYHANYTGSTMAMTNGSGVVTHKYSYDPYGRILEKTEADANRFTFVGRDGVMAEDGGLYFMRARYYDAMTGRFLGEDPVWTPALYAYANSSPLMFSDPDGRKTRSVVDEFKYTFCITPRDTPLALRACDIVRPWVEIPIRNVKSSILDLRQRHFRKFFMEYIDGKVVDWAIGSGASMFKINDYEFH